MFIEIIRDTFISKHVYDLTTCFILSFTFYRKQITGFRQQDIDVKHKIFIKKFFFSDAVIGNVRQKIPRLNMSRVLPFQ